MLLQFGLCYYGNIVSSALIWANCFLLDNDREKLASFARRATKKNNLEIEHRDNKLMMIINKLTVMMEMKMMVIELIMMVVLMATR